jgi:2-dehydropantoate 2-reductase
LTSPNGYGNEIRKIISCQLNYAMAIAPDQSIKVAVLGAGGVGGLLGAVLARQGHDVVFIAREATCDLIVEQGVSVRSKRFGNFAVKVQATPALHSRVDVCLVAVKATQLNSAVDRVPRDALGRSLIVPFLNGIEHIATLRNRYGNMVVPATIRVEAARVLPGIIEITSPFAFVELALAKDSGSARSTDVYALKHHLGVAGLEVEIRQDELSMLWGKLCFLAPLALLTTHENAPAGVVRSARRQDLLAVIHEVAEVANCAGARVDQQAVTKLFDSIPETMQSSMQRDVAAGRSTEIDAIGGAILRAAAQLKVKIPVTARLVADLQSRQSANKVQQEGSAVR